MANLKELLERRKSILDEQEVCRRKVKFAIEEKDKKGEQLLAVNMDICQIIHKTELADRPTAMDHEVAYIETILAACEGHSDDGN